MYVLAPLCVSHGRWAKASWVTGLLTRRRLLQRQQRSRSPKRPDLDLSLRGQAHRTQEEAGGGRHSRFSTKGDLVIGGRAVDLYEIEVDVDAAASSSSHSFFSKDSRCKQRSVVVQIVQASVSVSSANGGLGI